MSRPRPSEGTEPTIVLQIAPTGNSDNAFRLGPIVAVFSPCEQEAGFIFSLLLFFCQMPRCSWGYLLFEVGLAALWFVERRGGIHTSFTLKL